MIGYLETELIIVGIGALIILGFLIWRSGYLSRGCVLE